MKTLDLNQMQVIDGGSCVGSVAMAGVAVASLAFFIAFPPAGLAALMIGGAVAGIGAGGGIGLAVYDCTN